MIRKNELPACWCVHDDHWFLGASIQSFKACGPALVFISRTPWHGKPGDWERCAKVAQESGAEVILGDWTDESTHRRFALEEMKRRGCSYVSIPDSDEIIDTCLLKTLNSIAQCELADTVRVHMDTYWKGPRYVIRPREALAPVLLLDIRSVSHDYIREYMGEKPLVLGPEHGVLHHLSYAGPSERILRKISTWSHRDEVVREWVPKIWEVWDRDHRLTNLHPTHLACYGFTERIPLPKCLTGVRDDVHEALDPELPTRWPKVSVIIPLHGGEGDIKLCLSSLEGCQDILHETIVVDDVSPDRAAEVAQSFGFAKVIRNEKNLGFGGTCNRGYYESTGDVVIFLNSDTAVPRAGLIRLVESLISSGSIGAAGPYTNNCGYHQPTFATYTDISRLDLFAQDFAMREAYDEDVPMLVGFCIALRRSTLEELADPPFDERFGRGLFEDNDLCYRLLRAGYRLRLAARSYVHHKGSQTLNRQEEPPVALLERNKLLFHEKWKEDIESGFASHLPGQLASPVTFREERRPDRVHNEIAELVKQADISLVMIAKNEERVIGDCLRSIQGVFSQVVVVDTGSTDRTIGIARELGAEVHEHPWQDSFSEARNHSLDYARGRWIMWMDADDTLPKECAERILRAVVSAPPSVSAFVIPVQFVEEGLGAGTRVDHVKVFRNLPRIRFEGRIHEQVLSSIRASGGEVVRLDGAVVLHSGYDTSDGGQARKRDRDWKLLSLDIEERPGHPFVLFNLGMTAHYTGRHEEAVDWLRQSISKAEAGESHVRKAYALLGVSIRELGHLDEAVAAFEEGIAVVGKDPELQFQRALVLTSLERFAEARIAYLDMPNDVSRIFTSLDTGILTFKRSHNIANLCFVLGRYTEARDWWKRALDENPQFAVSAQALFDAAFEVGDPVGMAIGCDHMREVLGTGEAWAELEVRRAQRLGLDVSEHLSLLKRTYPGATGPGLLVARKLLEDGMELQALPLLSRLEAQGSAEASFYLGVSATRRGQYVDALRHMKRSLALNPGHEQTMGQVEALSALIETMKEGTDTKC